MNTENQDINQLKKLYQQLEFIHQVLTQRSTFYTQEFELASDATKMLTDLANKVSDQIREIDAKNTPETATEAAPSEYEA